ncbi:MAG: argininosuccinate lyase [Clostridia bacterium]|nr:argininosuccinate lyase [Clostridia bacterium]
MSDKKLWGGRFTKSTNAAVDDFNSSIRFDQRLYYFDIMGSIAHAEMLGKQNIISSEDAEKIVNGLNEVMKDIENGTAEFDISAEDIHMNVEKLLTERIGEPAKKLHTARSRNDQVAVDSKMYTKDIAGKIKKQLVELIAVFTKIAQENLYTIMPGYTHMQKAQPVTLAFHMMAYVEMFKRDIHRIENTIENCSQMPLGSGALAGVTYNIDRDYTAKKLGFAEPTLNAMDSVSDRDFVLDFIYSASVVMMHLSRFSEEVILWSTDEFGFIVLDDAYSTGSSIMPQKKNPDVAELIRGKTGRVYGDLMGTLAMMKGLPLAYNKDMQEDKESLFDAYDTVSSCIFMFTKMIETAKFNKDNMAQGAEGGYTNATDVADYLAKKGVPFRSAHEIVGKLVLFCIENNITLSQVSMEQYKQISEHFAEDIYEAINTVNCAKQRKSYGGPAPESVQKMIDATEKYLEGLK